MKPHTSPPHLFSPEPIRRRTFLRRGAGFSGAAWISSLSMRGASPTGQLHHACIGVGGMGWVDLQNFQQHPKVRVEAICDVDANHLAKAAEVFPEARRYHDWRELLSKEGDKIDSVNVTVPDHMHYPIALSAIRAGKHVYCQKPLCHDVREVRLLTEAAARAGVVTQLGTQGASTTGERMAVEFLRKGVIGKIKRAYLCSNRPGAVEDYRLPGPRPAVGQAPPEHLNWDLWIGTAPERDYAPDIYHPTRWRAWQDFGTGWSGDIGCHLFDAMWKGLELGAPLTVMAKVQESWRNSADRRAETWPQANHITWTFPGNARTAGPELVVEWFDGAYYPPEEIRALYSIEDYPPESAMLVGTEGAMLIAHASSPILLPDERFAEIKRPQLEPRNHYHHFADACLGGDRTESLFARSGPMTEAILLGTVAIRVPDTLLRWEPGQLRIPNSLAAEKLLARSYRKGWTV